MVALIILVALALLNAWFGWQRNLKAGLAAALLLPVVLALVAAFALPLPAPDDVGKLWMFGVCFVVLAAVSLASLGTMWLLSALLARQSPGN
jgi:integral membrane sensor domain MASE1